MGKAAERSFAGARREHQALRDRLARLEKLADASEQRTLARLPAALDEFLDDWGPRLTAHIETEERLVAPRLAGSLPSETGTLEAFRHERSTFGAVLDLLQQSRERLQNGESEAEGEVAAALRDLSSLWDVHVRRVDLLGPLLETLEDSARA